MDDAGNTISLISLPVISALIGWGTNYLAVKMIFRPHRPVRIFGFTLQGLVPKRQRELALSVAETIHQNLFSLDDILAQLSPEELAERFYPLIQSIIYDLLQKKFSQVPVLGMFLQGELIGQIRALLVNEIIAFTPNIVHELSAALEQKVNIGSIIQRRVEELDLGSLERIVYKIASRELKAIEYLGGVLGFLIGLMQAGIVLSL